VIVIGVLAGASRADEPPLSSGADGWLPAETSGLRIPDAQRPLVGVGPRTASASAAVPQGPHPGAGAEALRTGLSLGAVLALLGGCAWVFKRLAARGGSLLGAAGAGGKSPAGILEVLGRYPISRGTTLLLLRADRRVLLISQSAGGVRGAPSLSTLTEFTSPAEVASLITKARDGRGESIASNFAASLAAADRATGAALDRTAREDTRSGQPVAGPAHVRRREVVSSAGDRAELWEIPARTRGEFVTPLVSQPVPAPIRAPSTVRRSEPEAESGSSQVDSAAEKLRRRLVALRSNPLSEGGE